MESFDIDASHLAALSTFNTVTLTVSADFADKDDYLDEVEAEYGLGFVNDADGDKVQIDLAGSRAQLLSTLRKGDNLNGADTSGPSKRTGADGASNGDMTDRSKDTMARALDGKEKALREIDLKIELAATKEREERQRKENEELRAMLEQARIQQLGQGASPPAQDESSKTTRDSGGVVV
jgi:hypothetical protein